MEPFCLGRLSMEHGFPPAVAGEEEGVQSVLPRTHCVPCSPSPPAPHLPSNPRAGEPLCPVALTSHASFWVAKLHSAAACWPCLALLPSPRGRPYASALPERREGAVTQHSTYCGRRGCRQGRDGRPGGSRWRPFCLEVRGTAEPTGRGGGAGARGP